MTRLVADASAIVDLLAGAPNAGAIAAALAPFPEIDVPEHFHVEALSALRGMLLRGDIAADHAERALQLLPELRVVRHPVEPLTRSIWSMRDTLTAYDAAYLAVARNINAQLLTVDRGLAAAARQEQRLIEIAVVP
ncbi:MAG: type II toxin-antitoxin system VapC family toxin [Baekduia sp.]